MKKVVLLGDSIRLIGYGPKIPELLGSDYQVWQSEDNCRFVKYTLRCLFDWREDIKDADIIHWNNGLWDTSTGLFDDGGKLSLMLNPEIVKASGEYETEEGCLSLLGGPRKTKRYRKIKVRYQTEQFQIRMKTFEGFTAQIIQHEVDHCNGILI